MKQSTKTLLFWIGVLLIYAISLSLAYAFESAPSAANTTKQFSF